MRKNLTAPQLALELFAAVFYYRGPSRIPAGVAELVDARDSKSRSFGSIGSIPIAGILFGF